MFREAGSSLFPLVMLSDMEFSCANSLWGSSYLNAPLVTVAVRVCIRVGLHNLLTTEEVYCRFTVVSRGSPNISRLLSLESLSV